MLLTGSFVGGTTLACLALGATLGSFSLLFPPAAGRTIEVLTSAVLILVGIILIYNPSILHNHGHCGCQGEHHHDGQPCCQVGEHHHDHDHHHGHEHGHEHGQKRTPLQRKAQGAWLPASLFGIGFLNMLVPCPTVAVMYGYALNSGSAMASTLVFGSYAISTAISVGLVIFSIFKISTMAGKLDKSWLEPALMRTSGFIIMIFAGYSLYTTAVI